VFNQAAYTTKSPLLASTDEPRFSSKGEKRLRNATSDHPWTNFHDVEVGPVPPSREESKK